MKLTDLLLAELEREADGTRNALARVPEGHNDWKPHPKSMPLGYLASLVATMPSWVAMMVNQDELDLKSPAAAKFKPLEWRTRAELAMSEKAKSPKSPTAETPKLTSRPVKFLPSYNVTLGEAQSGQMAGISLRSRPAGKFEMNSTPGCRSSP